MTETKTTKDSEKDGKRRILGVTEKLIRNAWDAEIIRMANYGGQTVYCILPSEPAMDARLGTRLGIKIVDPSKMPGVQWKTVWENTVER